MTDEGEAKVEKPMADKDKKSMLEKAYSAIMLSVSDKVVK